jgi:type II secretory pathway pseudopilin PulG
MPRAARLSRPRPAESGYGFLVVMGMVLIIAVLSQAVLQNMLTSGRRAREDEMVWRGNQYVRAIRLYYRKTGHYPQTIDDLKTGMPQLQFLRSVAYKDPTDKDKDGAWRFIYINATGQIIGSVRYATLQQMALMDLNGGKIPVNATLGSIGTPAAALAAGASGATSAGQNPAATGGTGSTSTGTSPPSANNPSGASDTSGQSGSPGSSSNPAASSSASSDLSQAVNPLSLLKPTGPVDGPVLGGLLTGVGGGTDSDAPSIKVVSGGKKYKDWEFIWNPLEDQARALQAGLGGLNQAGGASGAPGSTSNLSNPGSSGTGFGGALLNPPSSQPQPPPSLPPQN